MPVYRNGDIYTYIPPTAAPCPLCGVAVVSEYGSLDARAYANGTVLRHLCEVEVDPLNQKQWLELQASLKPEPLPVVAAPVRRRNLHRPPPQRLDETWLL